MPKSPPIHDIETGRLSQKAALKALAVKAGVPLKAGEINQKLAFRIAVKLGATLHHNATPSDVNSYLLTRLAGLL